MTTIKDLVELRKCRVGKTAGTTKRGAYWLAHEPIRLRRFGGDGLGNNGPDVSFDLLLRHYRSGEIQACIHRDAWHQNGGYSGGGDRYESFPSILDCTTIEELIVTLKASRFDEGDFTETVYSDSHEDKLTAALMAFGLPLAAPSPDDVPAV